MHKYTFLSQVTIALDEIAQTYPECSVHGVHSYQIDIEFFLDTSFFSREKKVYDDRDELKATSPKNHLTI